MAANDVHVFAIFDGAAQAFQRPFFMPSVPSAQRIVRDEVNRAAQDNLLYQHPEDFRLFHLGTWSESSGMFEQKGIPELVCDCSALKQVLAS